MAAEEEEEQEEEILLHLFDLYWFKNQILTNPTTTSSINPSQKQTHNKEESTTPTTNPSPDLHVITPSIDHHPRSSKYVDVESPTSVLSLSKETEQFSEEEAVKRNKKKHHRRKKSSRLRKSLTELEHEELKGFMELGFEFSEEAKESPWLVGILPGLQRQARVGVSRPYLSESWKDKKKVKNYSVSEMKMMSCRIPSLSNENDMKKHLMIWAHAVASAIKHDKGN